MDHRHCRHGRSQEGINPTRPSQEDIASRAWLKMLQHTKKLLTMATEFVDFVPFSTTCSCDFPLNSLPEGFSLVIFMATNGHEEWLIVANNG